MEFLHGWHLKDLSRLGDYEKATYIFAGLDCAAKRMRDHIAASLARGEPSDSIAACRKRTATCWELFGAADATAGAMAQAADQHANEVKLLLDAWPGDSGN